MSIPRYRKILLFLILFILPFCYAEGQTIKATGEDIIEQKIIDDVVEYSYKTVPVPYDLGEIQEKRTPHSITYDLGDNKRRTIIYGGQEQFYFIPEENAWYQKETATTTIQNWNKEMGYFSGFTFWDILTAYAEDFFPSVDGYIENRAIPTWSGAHDAVSGTDYDVNGTGTLYLACSIYLGNYYLDRGLVYFDTSSLGASAEISTATLSVYGSLKDGSGESALSLVGVSGASSPTSYIYSDFSKLGTTKLSDDISVASFNASGNNDFVLNASGLSNISKTGVSYFGFRHSLDIADTPPTGLNDFRFQASETAGTEQDPKIVIEWTVAETPATGGVITFEPGIIDFQYFQSISFVLTSSLFLFISLYMLKKFIRSLSRPARR